MSAPPQPQTTVVAGCPAYRSDGDGPPVLLIAGPPMSARLFAKTQARLSRSSVAVELVGSKGEGDVASLARTVEEAAAELGASVVVAHGLAVPVALQTRGLELVLLNGPLGRVDTVTGMLARLGSGALRSLVLRRSVLDRWLASSLGLRRLVANPYAMDRDIVVALSHPVTQDAHSVATAADWIVDAARPGAVDGLEDRVIAAIWGDHDPLYPLASIARLVPRERVQAVPGGRHLFPEERPWELADRLDEVLRA